MFVIGVLMIIGAALMVAGGILGPEAARPGLVGGAIGVGLAGLLLAYLDAPSKREKPPAGSVRGKATILDATGMVGSVNGYQMVELTLEVRPKGGGVPFQVKRKFSSGRLGRIEVGGSFDVHYDPANPEKIDLG